ncbi:MAG: MTH1187 family thiamine-binding protein [Candidatus Omnitrophica bacterium]|nr:MTH1187 family thiamine-binding protein [Candidatus Omnitrophota bacterium]
MLAEISVVPVGVGVSLSAYIARVADIIDKSGLDYRINPMGTVVEGSLDEVMQLVKECHGAVLKDAQRVIISAVMDERKDKPSPRLDKKVEAVEAKTGRPLRKGL